MARIRTIKPDFWTDEKLTECSLSARLFFIGTWNFSDDNGNLPRSAKKLKMQIFPADAMDCEPLVQELLQIGVLIEYKVGADAFLHIKGFRKHQVINRPSKTSLPQPDFAVVEMDIPDESRSTHGVLTDGREEEGKGREEERTTTNPVGLVVASDAADQAGPAAKPPCQHEAILALYHELLPASPPIRDWTPTRAAVLRTRWNEDPKRQNLDYWRRFFTYIAESPFLTGRKTGKDGRAFTPGLEWILKAENFAKIREGRYHQEAA